MIEASYAPAKKAINYPFVDLIRFVSIMGVVWAHSGIYTGYKDINDLLNNVGGQSAYICFMQIFRFGVINFFIISGFLLGDKIKNEDRTVFYLKRLQSTIRPFLVVFCIMLVFMCLREYIKFHNFHFFKFINILIFHSYLWFLPNYLIALLVIIFLRKYLDSKIFGGLFFLITICYPMLTSLFTESKGADTSPMLGYVFYIWLGVYIRRHDILLKKIQNVKLDHLVFLLIVIYGLSCIEACNLLVYKFDSFRLFNHLYAITIFAFLVRICGNSKPVFGILNPRKETYGIYLYHILIAWYILPRFIAFLYDRGIFDPKIHDIYAYMIYHILFFAITYVKATFTVKALIKYNLSYLQG